MSMQDQEKKNFKVADIIMGIAWVVAHLIFIGVSANKFGLVKAHSILWALPVISLIYTVWLILKTGGETFQEKWGWYGLGILLLGASCVALAYCPQC